MSRLVFISSCTCPGDFAILAGCFYHERACQSRFRMVGVLLKMLEQLRSITHSLAT